jgi:hypothetical protein
MAGGLEGKVVQTFTDLIAPVASQLFFAEHWEAKPLHIRRDDPHFYDRLITATSKP